MLLISAQSCSVMTGYTAQTRSIVCRTRHWQRTGRQAARQSYGPNNDKSRCTGMVPHSI